MIKIKQIHVAAAVIVNKDKNKILVTKRQGGEFDGLWEFPGGKIEENESSQEATIREVKEELSLDIKVVGHFTTIQYQYDNFHLLMDLHWSSIASGQLELKEHSEYMWASKDQLEYLNWVPADVQLVEKIKKVNFLQ